MADEYVEPAHEALIRAWDKMLKWREEEAEKLTLQRAITQATYGTGGLWTNDKRLSRALELLATDPYWLNTEESDFIRQSARRRKLNWRGLWAGIGSAFVVLSTLAIYASFQRYIAVRNAQTSLSRQMAVQSRLLVDTNIELSLLLADKAYQIDNTVEAQGALLQALEQYPQLIVCLGRHSFPVMSLTVGPDGKTLRSIDRDGNVRVWDLPSRQLITESKPIREPFSALAWNTDGSVLITGTSTGIVRMFNSKSGAPLGPAINTGYAEGVYGGIHQIAFSSDGRTIACTGLSGFKIWDGKTGNYLGPPKDTMTNEEPRLAFSPDGKVLASSEESIIRLLDPRTGKTLHRPFKTGLSSGIECLTFSPQPNMLASGSPNGIVCFWNVLSGKCLGRLNAVSNANISTLVFSHDGNVLAVGSTDGSLQLFDMAVDADGNTLIPGWSPAKPLWDIHRRTPYGESVDTNNTVRLAFNSDRIFLVSGDEDGSIKLWSVRPNKPFAQLSVSHLAGMHRGLAFSPDGEKLASVLADGTVQVREVESHRLIKPDIHTGYKSINAGFKTSETLKVIFGPSNTLITGGSDGRLTLWRNNVSTPIEQSPRSTKKIAISSLAVSHDGSVLAAGYLNGEIQLWNLQATHSIGGPIKAHHGRVSALVFSGLNTLVSGGFDGSLKLWNINSSSPVGELVSGNAHGAVTSLAITLEGLFLASGWEDGTIGLWDVQKRIKMGQPIKLNRGIRCLSFSFDGKVLVSSGELNDIRLWNGRTGLPFGPPLRTDGLEPDLVSFCSGGAMLATSMGDGGLELWDINAKSWQIRARTIANRDLTADEEYYFVSQNSSSSP